MTTQTILKRQTNFVLSLGTIQLLKQNIPNKKQSEFVEELIIKELNKRNFLRILKKAEGAWKNHKEDTETFIRSLRNSKRL